MLSGSDCSTLSDYCSLAFRFETVDDPNRARNKKILLEMSRGNLGSEIIISAIF